MIAPIVLITLGLNPALPSLGSLKQINFANSSAPSHANTYITVNVKSGDTVSGIVKFRVIVHTEDIITKVEYYQDGNLVSYQTSTPYKFSLDTTLLKDGPYKVEFIAYTDSGSHVKKNLTLNINNGLSATPASHVAKGKTLLSQGNVKGAIEEARVALRIDDHNVGARLLLAQCYYNLKQYDQAQNYCDEILGDAPTNLPALDLASAIGVREAFGVIAQSGQSDQGLQLIKQALDYAIDNRNKYLKAQLNAANESTIGPWAYADLANKAHQYSIAIQTINPIFQKNEGDTKAANYLAYSQFLEGRFADALTTLDLLRKAGGHNFDAYTKALQALLAAHLNENSTADKVLSDAILDDMTNLGVQTAQASIALEEKNTSALSNLLQSLSADSGQLPEVNYLVSAVANQLGNFSLARKELEQGLLADASWDTLYVEAGNQILSQALNTKESDKISKMEYKTALMYFGEALRAKGDSFQALTGLSIASALDKKYGDALQYAQDAVKAQPDYAAGQYALAMALSLNSHNNEAETALAQAAKLDTSRLQGMEIPNPVEAWSYFSSGGRTLVISAP